jgi:O-antigen ligase
MKVIEGSAIGVRRAGKTRLSEHSYPLAYLIFLCAMLMFGVLAFGAVETWSASILEIGAALLFTVMVLHKVCISGARVRWNPLYPPMLGFAAIAAIQLILNMTAYRYETLAVVIQYLAYGMLLFAATQIARDERSCKIIVLMFSIFGSAVALFAICQNLSSTLLIYWLRTPAADASIFGPYINHDHYAGLMEMLTPLALVLSLSSLVQGGQRILAAFAAVLMAGSIVLSLSRGGAISLLAELPMLFWMMSRMQKGTLARTRMLLLVVAILTFLAFIGSPVMWHHLGHLQDALRIDILKDSLRMVAQKPILGWGLGTFPDAYPAFRSFYTAFFINAAHNDYIQVLVETGLAGFSCVVWFIIALYRSGLRGDGGDQDWRGVLRVATLVGCTGILVHSFFDFNLQVPGNAALFYVFCALAAGLPANSDILTSSSVRVYKRESNFY